MGDRIRFYLVAPVVLILCLLAVDRGSAKVVNDGKSGPTNPAVEAGGRHLSPSRPTPVPYSFIGSIAAEGGWLTNCIAWPWHFVRDHFQREHFARHRIGEGFGPSRHVSAGRPLPDRSLDGPPMWIP